MKWEPWSKSDQICGRFKSSAQIGRYSVGVGATKVWRFYVSATSATNVALVWHQKGGLTRSLDDLGIICTWGAPQLPSLTNLNPQSSVLNPHCTTKCGTFMFVPHVPQMWYKCGTQMRPHTFFRSQSSILGSQSSLYPKSGVLLSLYPKYPKWGTSGVHKRGLTRFLDDLSIMHLMYVYIK